MKKCYRCKQLKDDNEFSKNKAKKDGLQASCILCKRAYDRDYYKDRIYDKSIRRKNTLARRDTNRKIVYNHLKSHPCVDCGETDVIVLEFDHIKDKKYNISSIVGQGMSDKLLIAEIDKCEVRCANCHRRKTSKQFNHFRYIDP